VNQLEHRGQGRGPRGPGSSRLIGQQEQRRPEQLALHLEQVRIDLGDQAEITLDDPPQLAAHQFQPVAKRGLDLPQRHAHCLGAHARFPVSFFMRLRVSWNPMSTAITRS